METIVPFDELGDVYSDNVDMGPGNKESVFWFEIVGLPEVGEDPPLYNIRVTKIRLATDGVVRTTPSDGPYFEEFDVGAEFDYDRKDLDKLDAGGFKELEKSDKKPQRGRPPKAKSDDSTAETTGAVSSSSSGKKASKAKKKRKAASLAAASLEASSNAQQQQQQQQQPESPPAKKKRGRPRKIKPEEAENNNVEVTSEAKEEEEEGEKACAAAECAAAEDAAAAEAEEVEEEALAPAAALNDDDDDDPSTALLASVARAQAGLEEAQRQEKTHSEALRALVVKRRDWEGWETASRDQPQGDAAAEIAKLAQSKMVGIDADAELVRKDLEAAKKDVEARLAEVRERKESTTRQFAAKVAEKLAARKLGLELDGAWAAETSDKLKQVGCSAVDFGDLLNRPGPEPSTLTL